MYCPKCATDVETTVRETTETYPVKGEEITIQARVRFCSICGEDIWDDELDAQNLLDAYAEYRRRHGLLQPSEIRATREKYGLSQVAFARVLGLGDKTIARYENGSIADLAQNNLIELAQQPSNFKLLLEKNQSKISPEDYCSALDALEKLRLVVIYGQQQAVMAYSQQQAYSFTEDKKLRYRIEFPLFWGDAKYA